MPKPKRYPCALCGRQLEAEQMIWSRYTKQRYCGVDLARCEHQAAKRRRRHLSDS